MGGIANSYAQGLYSLCVQENMAQTMLGQLCVLDESFRAEPGFLKLLSSPELPKAQRCQILDEAFRGKLHPYLLNFLKILTEKGYIRHFSQCCKAYEDQYNLDNGILPVRAVTAVPLTQAQSQKLTEKLQSITGKTVRLFNRVDPACMGGVRLEYDGKQVDGTVKNRLDSIGDLLSKTVL